MTILITILAIWGGSALGIYVGLKYDSEVFYPSITAAIIAFAAASFSKYYEGNRRAGK